MPRKLARALGLTFKSSVALEGLGHFANMLPGFNPGQIPLEVGFVSNLGGLPLYKTCSAIGPPTNTLEQATLGQANSCLTGQAVTPGSWDTFVAAGNWLSTFSSHRYLGPNNYRGDELNTYGPAPAGGFRPRQSYVRPNLQTFIWPKVLPWALLPVKYILAEPWAYEHAYGSNRRPALLHGFRMTPHRPPGPKVKERKSKMTRALLAFVNAVSEGADFIDAMHEALPKELQSKLTGNKANQTRIKGQDLYRHWDKIDLDTAVFNVLWQQAEDVVYGKLGVKVPGRYGGALGANKGLNTAFGDAQADLLKAANQRTRELVSRMTGLTFIN